MRGYQFDFRGFVKAFGGPTAVWRALNDVGIPVKRRTVNKWIEREDIAVIYLVNLMAHRALDDGPIDLNRFIRPAQEALALPRAPGSATALEPQPPSVLRG